MGVWGEKKGLSVPTWERLLCLPILEGPCQCSGCKSTGLCPLARGAGPVPSFSPLESCRASAGGNRAAPSLHGAHQGGVFCCWQCSCFPCLGDDGRNGGRDLPCSAQLVVFQWVFSNTYSRPSGQKQPASHSSLCFYKTSVSSVPHHFSLFCTDVVLRDYAVD